MFRKALKITNQISMAAPKRDVIREVMEERALVYFILITHLKTTKIIFFLDLLSSMPMFTVISSAVWVTAVVLVDWVFAALVLKCQVAPRWWWTMAGQQWRFATFLGSGSPLSTTQRRGSCNALVVAVTVCAAAHVASAGMVVARAGRFPVSGTRVRTVQVLFSKQSVVMMVAGGGHIGVWKVRVALHGRLAATLMTASSGQIIAAVDTSFFPEPAGVWPVAGATITAVEIITGGAAVRSAVGLGCWGRSVWGSGHPLDEPPGVGGSPEAGEVSLDVWGQQRGAAGHTRTFVCSVTRTWATQTS